MTQTAMAYATNWKFQDVQMRKLRISMQMPQMIMAVASTLDVPIRMLKTMIRWPMSTMAVGTNLAAAFTLFGTLAIVRFRTAIKEPIDAAFVIFSVVIGLATGNQSLIVATVGTAVIAVTIVILLGVKNFGNNTQEGDLRLVLDGVDVPESSWGDVLRAHDLNYTIESCSLDRAAATQSLRINVTGVKAENWPTLLNALLVVPEVQRASGRPLDA